MDEKKLNEEDIINGLRCMAGQKACDLCKYNDLAEQGEGTCMNLVAEDTLELISEQKAEIERLTSSVLKYAETLGNEQRKSAELQKQVDELKERYLEESKERCELEQRYKKIQHVHNIGVGTQRKHWEKKVHQAVKDTAKEICDLILEHWEKKQFVECDWLRVAISEKYGVEVGL